METILGNEDVMALCEIFGTRKVRNAIRALQGDMRASREVPDWAIDGGGYAARIHSNLRGSTYEPVFNLTGTVIHTNLGRSLLSPALWSSVEPLVTRPVNLEYDLTQGKRGDRDKIVEDRIRALTGCEAATVVNNNAAALLLVLNTFALGKKVPVSRGELIEIGGSFRLPELMTRAGCELIEVGTTNRTHLRDFEAVTDETSMLLKVHPSNYHVTGFTKEVSARELAVLGGELQVPSCVDLGSGTLVDLTRWGLPHEPTPQSILEQGIDLVTFSGDKLLGGVQAGIIVGAKELLDQIKKNPLKRALRADKITLAVLNETLKLYEDSETLRENIPLLRTLTTPLHELQSRAERLAEALPESLSSSVRESSGQIGSGAVPDQGLESMSLVISHESMDAQALINALRNLPTPVIGRIHEDQVWLDMRCAEPEKELLEALSHLS